MNVTFRPPLPGDIESIGDRMRQIDVVECATAGLEPHDALERGWDASVICWTGEIDGEPEAMFGVTAVSLATGWGRPWLLGTDRARTAARAFLKDAPAYLDRIERIFPKLDNYVSANNAVAIRWLRKLGFVVEDDHAVEMNGEPMFYFHKGL